MNLSTMLGRLIITLGLFCPVFAQDYAWPIRASQSLSATFCEYRSGHLHAGVDIKTWGEMEVPCLAIDNGYIERVIINYHGYGRGLFLRTSQGQVAVYGHLERFPKAIEMLIREAQLEHNRYAVRLNFGAEDFPVRRGQIVGYSGTSGTEHPHLHFEIRDTLGTVINPQQVYQDIRDTRAPIIDEFLIIPHTPDSRVFGSRLPSIINPDLQRDPVPVFGALQLAVNGHDRADGTFNKYNVYRSDLFFDDSLLFTQTFDQLPLELSDFVNAVYPGLKGKRGWRFMSLFQGDSAPEFPFRSHAAGGVMEVSGLSSVQVDLHDIKGNRKSASMLLQKQAPGDWSWRKIHDQLHLKRLFHNSEYAAYQFYTGQHQFIPLLQTLHGMHSTEWVFPDTSYPSGIQALGNQGGEILWVLPPQDQALSDPVLSWYANAAGYFFQVNSQEAYRYPLQARLVHAGQTFDVMLTQLDASKAESSLIPVEVRARSSRLELLHVGEIIAAFDLDPLQTIEGGSGCEYEIAEFGWTISGENWSTDPLYIECDTMSAQFDNQVIQGIRISMLGDVNHFKGLLTFTKPAADSSSYSFFKPGKRGTWDILKSLDSNGVVTRELEQGGSYFLIQDNAAPRLELQEEKQRYKQGDRILFNVIENTGRLPRPRHALQASLDGALFFPDYNPLRKELSFHVPHDLGPGPHLFQVSITDQIGNRAEHRFDFQVSN